MSQPSPKQISFITLGCAKNEVDTAHMTARLCEAAYDVLDWDELEQAAYTSEETLSMDDPTFALDAIIVNTCSFLQEAIEENLEVIFDLAELPAVANGRTKLIVAGCMPARFGADLQAELTEPDLFIPCAEEDRIVDALDKLLEVERPSSQTAPDPSTPTQIAPGPSAYVKISDGCNRFCSFCAIPFIRGRYHSFDYETIATEVEQLIAQGTKEIVLIAQDTGRWGSDLEPKRTLAWLLDQLATAYPNTWFRVLYIQPEHLDDALLETMVAHPNICNYLDIPFQHVDANLLASMNRKGSRETFEALLAHVRAVFPEVALRTTFIVGYPGETDEMFEELCDFTAEADLDYVGVFAFSSEESTRAAELPDQIDDETKQERLRTLRGLADTISSSRLARFVGVELPVLVLGCEEDGQLFGRSPYQAPDVDGVTYLDEGEIGQIVPVIIEDTLYYEMEGSRVH